MIKVSRQTAASLSEDAVRQQILSGELGPGTKVTEEALARDLSVSRATVRQALNTLTLEGLLTRHPRTRVLEVTRISAADVVDIYRARRVLELAGVEASATADDDSRQLLRRHVEAMAVAAHDGDILGFVLADTQCHSQTVAFSGSQVLVDTHRQIMTRLRLAMTRAESAEPNLAAELQTHQDFCQLILDGDVEGARANLTCRLDRAEQDLLAHADAATIETASDHGSTPPP